MTEGVIAVVVLGAVWWRVLDRKPDVVADEAWAQRRVQYGRQVQAYAEMLAALTGIPATATIERVAGPG